MKIVVLSENTQYQPDYAAEHGLSLYIQTERHRILFDFGKSGIFADNADRLGIDLGRIDFAVLSHGHYDHGGGILRFLELNGQAPVYVNRNAFGSFYSADGRYLGLDGRICESERIIITDDYCRIDDGIELCTLNGLPHDSYSRELFQSIDGRMEADLFLHEQYLVIQEGSKRIVFSGCSHKGITNIIGWLEPNIFVGGFHTMDIPIAGEKCEPLDLLAESLGKNRTSFFTCHCTGKKQYLYLNERMGERLHYIASGQTVEL